MAKLQEITLEDVYEAFSYFDNWEDRYRYILDLAKKLPPFPVEEKIEENKVRGCMSQVWMIRNPHQDNRERFEFLADSDAFIVQGLIALLMIIYNGKTREEIEKIKVQEIFQKLELENHLSPTRRNGFYSMVERIRAFAKDTKE